MEALPIRGFQEMEMDVLDKFSLFWSIMKRNHLILGFILSVILVLFGAITSQWILMIIFVILIALVLVCSDVLQWVKTQTDQLSINNESIAIDIKSMKGSIELIKHDIYEIKQSLEINGK